MSVKAVNLELVSDLSTESFIACLRRLVAHGTNFVGANGILKELYAFLFFQSGCPILGVFWKQP